MTFLLNDFLKLKVLLDLIILLLWLHLKFFPNVPHYKNILKCCHINFGAFLPFLKKKISKEVSISLNCISQCAYVYLVLGILFSILFHLAMCLLCTDIES